MQIISVVGFDFLETLHDWRLPLRVSSGSPAVLERVSRNLRFTRTAVELGRSYCQHGGQTLLHVDLRRSPR